MPRTPPKHLTKRIGDFLAAHDNAACAPIHIESDDDNETPVEESETARSDLSFTQYGFTFRSEHETPTKYFTSRSSGTALRQSSSWSGLRDEERVVGGLVYEPGPQREYGSLKDLHRRRSPDSRRIEDPMRKPFKTPSGAYKPYNTLNGKSAFLQQRTSQARAPVHVPSANLPTRNDIHANDHGTPHKKRKVGDWQGPGEPAASAFPLDDTENPNDSEDELALDTKSNGGKVPGKHSRPHRRNDSEEKSIWTLRSRDKVHNHQLDQDGRSSPEDEGTFTKASAQQRKAEKDKILESPPELSKQPHTSPYFPYAGTRAADSNRQKQIPARAQSPESPDVLQNNEPQAVPESYALNSAPYPKMKTKDLGNLIIGNSSSTAVTKRSKELVKKPVETKVSFLLKELVYRDLLDASGYIIELNRLGREVSINLKDPLLGDEPVSLPRGFNQIIKLRQGKNESPLVSLHFVRTMKDEETMWLRFESHKLVVDFVGILKGIEKKLKVRTKADEWMDAAFSKAKSDTSRPKERPAMKTQIMNTSTTKPKSTSTETRIPTTRKSIRLVDILDAPSEASKQSPTTPAAEKYAPKDSLPPQESSHSLTVPRPVTRSRAAEERSSTEQGQDITTPKIKASQTGILGTPWTKDLVYPQAGRRAAVVPFDDLRRLDDGEFLNDNLIAFFMRYLETHMEKSNPEVHKRMHFFNTYFYEALSKTKGKKGINYDAVSRWTKNINLFSRDFIVVPVNENLHWYLAIICNLPYFLGKRSTGTAWSEELQPSDQQSEEDERDPVLPTDETERTLADLSLSDDEKRGQLQAKKTYGRRKPVRRSLPKYDVNKPVIITLDSLGSSRSATCSQLKQYVVSEARDKRNMDIDVTELKGMTAKEIPNQNNFSDCGLYLCMYLEQFVADPYNFVRRILQREENAQQWPSKIYSHDLRSRLRQLILEMHRRQEKQPSEMDEPDVGNILTSLREASRSPPVTQKSLTRQDVQEAQKRFDGITRSQPFESNNSATEDSGTSNGSQKEDRNDGLSQRQMSEAPTDRSLDNRPRQYSKIEPLRDTRSRAAPQARDVHPTPNALGGSPKAQGAHTPRSDKKRKLKDADDLGLKRGSGSKRRNSEMTDYLSGSGGRKSFDEEVRDYLAKVNALSPEYVARVPALARDAAAENIKEMDMERDRKSNCPSPEPQVIAERKVESSREANTLGKRKRPSGKSTAPESATEDEEYLRSDDEEIDVPRTWERERVARYGREAVEDHEMLFKM